MIIDGYCSAVVSEAGSESRTDGDYYAADIYATDAAAVEAAEEEAGGDGGGRAGCCEEG